MNVDLCSILHYYAVSYVYSPNELAIALRYLLLYAKMARG